MNNFQTTMRTFMANNAIIPPALGQFGINLVLAAILGFVLGYFYTKYGHSLSNRRLFSKNFPLLTMTTMFIIMIVKSSLALSLGLVGALSIVRFRAAIKEPEELAFLFLAISIGLGLGAGQPLLTIIAFALISLAIVIRHLFQGHEYGQDLLLTITSLHPQNITLEQIHATLRQTFFGCNLKRFDDSQEIIEALFLVEFTTFSQLSRAKDELRKLDDSIKISFMDNKGVF